MRSPADMDILVIDLTNRCFLKCSNCTRDIAHQTTTKEMSPETFRLALHSLRSWWKPGRVIGLIGGEPTLNSYFEEICRIFRTEFNPGAVAQGVAPIADMNDFAFRRLHDRSNGRGLWTSFGPRFMRHYETIMETFSHWNANDHTAGGLHQTSLVDRKEMMDALGIPEEKWPELRDNCWLQNTWSAAIAPNGKAYFCERAAHLDMLYNGGFHGWDIEAEPYWWMRKPGEFGDQLKLCEMCSMALPGPSQVDAKDTDIISEKHRIRLNLVGSPAVKAGRFELFDGVRHAEERREITTKDNYIPAGGWRVAESNEYVKPDRLHIILTCVGRAKHLKQTIERSAAIAATLGGAVVVSTDDADLETQMVVNQFDDVFVASSYLETCDQAFPKAKLLNRALWRLRDRVTSIKERDWLLFTDADILLPLDLAEFFRGHALNPGVIYGARRREGASPPGINAEPNGYFQLVNPIASSLPKVLTFPEEFCSAGGVDSWLMQQYPPFKRFVLPLVCQHIGHGEFGAMWNGFPRKLVWRQLGMMTGRGMHLIERPQFRGVTRFKLTETLHGKSVEVALNKSTFFEPHIVRPNGHGGLVFLDEDIGGAHVHVAYFAE